VVFGQPKATFPFRNALKPQTSASRYVGDPCGVLPKQILTNLTRHDARITGKRCSFPRRSKDAPRGVPRLVLRRKLLSGNKLRLKPELRSSLASRLSFHRTAALRDRSSQRG
jgi:hypothetical protein